MDIQYSRTSKEAQIVCRLEVILTRRKQDDYGIVGQLFTSYSQQGEVSYILGYFLYEGLLPTQYLRLTLINEVVVTWIYLSYFINS